MNYNLYLFYIKNLKLIARIIDYVNIRSADILNTNKFFFYLKIKTFDVYCLRHF